MHEYFFINTLFNSNTLSYSDFKGDVGLALALIRNVWRLVWVELFIIKAY